MRPALSMKLRCGVALALAEYADDDQYFENSPDFFPAITVHGMRHVAAGSKRVG
jgi:hypothetical protein